jgi:hypothetical protein
MDAIDDFIRDLREAVERVGLSEEECAILDKEHPIGPSSWLAFKFLELHETPRVLKTYKYIVSESMSKRVYVEPMILK